MHRSALPNAVRETLSRVALEVKKKTMPAQAKKAFVNRSKNFFKAQSRVEFARGYNINTMQSTVGFVEKGLSGQQNYAVKDLEQQERGGTIKGRAFIPTDKARGGSGTKLVKKIFHLAKIGKMINANKVKAKSKKQRFIKAALMAKKLHGENAFVIGNRRSGGKMTLSKINSVSSSLKGKKLVINRTPIYSIKKGRAVRIKQTNFMQRASMEAALRMETTYIQEARKQIQRLMKK